VSAPITLYVRTGGAHSDAKRQELRARGVTFTEVDVAAHPEAIPELMKLTGGRRIVPVIVEGARIQVAPDGGDAF
jgi:glutaredoxin